MKKLVLLVAPILLYSQTAMAQFESRRYTCPKIPPKEVLDRLDLKLAWTARIPTDGRRDGLASFQILPGAKGDEILVQTRSGMVQLMTAETGDLIWRAPVGLPYRHFHAAAYNEDSIFITRGLVLYALNRKTGNHRLFSIDKITGVPTLGFEMIQPPSAMGVADPVSVFYPAGRRVFGYLTDFREGDLNLPAVNPASGLLGVKDVISPLPDFLPVPKFLGSNINQPPVLAAGRLGVLGDEGVFTSFEKIKRRIIFQFKMRGGTSVAMAQFGETVYLGSDDFTVYALNIVTGDVDWRHLAGAPISRTPVATRDDVFVSAGRQGLARVNRLNGRLIWRNPEGNQFLAMNQKFVYATDSRGFLIVLDHLRGRTLARYNIRDFVVPITNFLTDRIYLAAHDGTVVCLHRRQNVEPFRPSAPVAQPPPVVPPPKGAGAAK